MKNTTPGKKGFDFGGKNLDIQKVMEMLNTMLRCPICGNKYKKDGTRVIESEQDKVYGEAYILIHSDCQKCKSSIVFSVDIKGPDVFSVGMITDLTQSDTLKFKSYGPIASGEIIKIHQGLKRFNGDFVAALTQKHII
jgi:hypothetical protein